MLGLCVDLDLERGVLPSQAAVIFDEHRHDALEALEVISLRVGRLIETGNDETPVWPDATCGEVGPSRIGDEPSQSRRNGVCDGPCAGYPCAPLDCSLDSPIRYRSTSRAASRPSQSAHTTSD